MNITEAKVIVKTELEIQRRKVRRMHQRYVDKKNHKRLVKMYNNSTSTY